MDFASTKSRTKLIGTNYLPLLFSKFEWYKMMVRVLPIYLVHMIHMEFTGDIVLFLACWSKLEVGVNKESQGSQGVDAFEVAAKVLEII